MWVARIGLVSAVAFAAVVSCGGSALRAQQFRGPDGSAAWWHLDCPRTFGDCLRGAGERCPDGWSEERESESHGIESTGYASRELGIAASSTRTTTERSLTIHCKGRSVDPGPECGRDNATHGCQGSTRWVPSTMSCEPC